MPHTELDQPGLNYVIQYYDINKAKIPKIAFKWMATSGLPDFIEKVHKAAHKLKQKYDAEKVNQIELISDVDLLYIKKNLEIIKKENQNENKNDQTNQNIVPINDKIQQEQTPSIEQKNISINNTSTNSNKILDNLNRFEQKRAQLLDRTNREFFKQDEPHPVFFN